MKKILLVVEKMDTNLVGRIDYEKNLIVESAKDLQSLENGIKKVLQRFYKVDTEVIRFDCKYDLSALFETFSYLKISKVAEIAGVNASLLRQYATGNKQASATQAQKIQSAIQKLGKQLAKVQVYGV